MTVPPIVSAPLNDLSNLARPTSNVSLAATVFAGVLVDVTLPTAKVLVYVPLVPLLVLTIMAQEPEAGTEPPDNCVTPGFVVSADTVTVPPHVLDTRPLLTNPVG